MENTVTLLINNIKSGYDIIEDPRPRWLFKIFILIWPVNLFDNSFYFIYFYRKLYKQIRTLFLLQFRFFEFHRFLFL